MRRTGRRSVAIAVAAFAGILLAVPAAPARARSDADNLLLTNPFGPVFGSIAARYERRVSDSLSLFGEARYRNRRAFGVYAHWLRDLGYQRAYSMLGYFGVHSWPDRRALEGWFAGGGPVAGYASVRNRDEGIDTSTAVLGLRGRVGHRWISDWFSFAPNLAVEYSELIHRDAEADGAIRAVSGIDVQIGLGIAVAF